VSPWNLIQDVGSIAGLIALLLGVWLSLRALGIFNRPSYTITANYLPERDSLGFGAMPHFVVEYRNTGNVPVTFSDFELVLPRHDIIQSGQLVGHLGADLFIDKRRSSRIGAMQHVRAIDYRTGKVELPPRSSHSDYFDLGAFLPDFDAEKLGPARVPPDFEPVLKLTDSWAHELWIDRHGVHDGRWKHRDEERLASEFDYRLFTGKTLTRRRTGLRRWKTDIKEPEPLDKD